MRVSNNLDPAHNSSYLILVQTVCKGYLPFICTLSK